LARVPARRSILQAAQDVRGGGRMSNAQYQFTMRGDNLQDPPFFAPRMLREPETSMFIADVSTDQQNLGLQSLISVRSQHGARFASRPQLIDKHAL